MKKKTRELLDKFLADRRKSDGGYALVEKSDIDLFYRLIYALIEEKWQNDCDGDYPVEVKIINRRTHERMHYLPVPYLHKCKTEDDFLQYIHAVNCNVGTACGKFDLSSGMISQYMAIAVKKDKDIV